MTEVSNLKYRIEGSVVMVVPLDDPDDVILHRTYKVLSDISATIDALAPATEAAGVAAPAFGDGLLAALERVRRRASRSLPRSPMWNRYRCST